MPLIQEAKIITRYYSKIARLWMPTISAWGIAGGATLLYLTDWKVVMKHVPYVGKKYDHESPR